MNNSISFDDFVKSNDAIFHYTKSSVALEKILYDGTFRLSLLKDTNDPREYKVKLLNMTGWSLPPEAEQLYNDAHQVFDRIIRMESRVMCFCLNEVPRSGNTSQEYYKDNAGTAFGWSKSRMWAQYGEDHRGLCLVFSKNEIEAQISDFKEVVFGQQVEYSNKAEIPLHVFKLDGNQLVKDGVEKYCYKHIRRHSMDLFFTKHIDYRDESEFRFVVIDPKGNHEFMNINKIIKGIIGGDRIPKVYFPLLRQLSKKYEIECRQAYWDRGRPFLVNFREE